MKHIPALFCSLILSLFLIGCQTNGPEVGDQFEFDGRQWELIWQDEFDGPAVNAANWNIADGPDGLNNDINYNLPKNVYIEDGVLVLRQEREQHEGFDYTTGKINSQNKFIFLYGRIEVHGQVPKGRGLHTAYWLVEEGCSGWAGGDNSQCIWPPEIDIVEVLGEDTTVMHTTYHAGTDELKLGTGKEHQLAFELSEDFHTYAVEWGPEEIRWYLDGDLVYTANDRFVTDVHLPFGITLDTVVGGNWPLPPDNQTAFPTYNHIDYVRVYKNVENPNPPTPMPTPTKTPDPDVGAKTSFSASASSEMPDWPVVNAVDRDPGTQWTSGENQTPGQWFQVDFGAWKIFNRITIQSSKPKTLEGQGWLDDYPRGYEIFVSGDGEAWGEPIATGNGSNEMIEITLQEATITRYLKIVQTGSTDTNWWTIFELSFFYDDKLIKP